MHKITRFHAASYEGWGLIDGDAIHELDNPWSGKRGRSHPLSGVRLLAACAPSKIVGVGRNYLEHARELGNEVPSEPLIFLKPPSRPAIPSSIPQPRKTSTMKASWA